MPTAVPPPPPLSALPGGFLKQLVRESEKETKQKEPEVKEDKAVSDLLVYPSSQVDCLDTVLLFFII